MSAASPEPPLDAEAIAALARRLLDLDIPPECLPGVADSMAVLADHARRVLGEGGA